MISSWDERLAERVQQISLTETTETLQFFIFLISNQNHIFLIYVISYKQFEWVLFSKNFYVFWWIFWNSLVCLCINFISSKPDRCYPKCIDFLWEVHPKIKLFSLFTHTHGVFKSFLEYGELFGAITELWTGSETSRLY